MPKVVNPPFESLQNVPASKLYIKKVASCVVTRSNLVVTPWGVDSTSLFENLSISRRVELNLVALASVIKNRHSRLQTESEVFHIFNIWGGGYHHWLTEVAPKLFLFEDEIRNGVILLPENSPHFVIDFLRDFGFENLVSTSGNVWIRNLQLVSNPNSGHYNPEHILPLRSHVLSRFGDGSSLPQRLYVSRRNSRGRKVVNDAEVENVLAARGFRTLELESVSFADQVRLFSRCDQLVSIHGAALTNMLFMPPGGKILEFYPSGYSSRDYFNACYYRLSNTLGHAHQYLFCERDRRDKKFDLHNDDIVVDVKELAQAID
jgi:capsular polysaccharide biosynthesis protein